MLPISFPSWLVWRPGWKWNTWWTLELCLCDNHTLCESLSMQIDPNNVNNVKVPTFTEEAGKKADLNWTLSEGSLSFEWEIMTEREDRWEYPDLKSNWLWWLLCDMTIDMKNWCTMQGLWSIQRQQREKEWLSQYGKASGIAAYIGKGTGIQKVSKFCSQGGHESCHLFLPSSHCIFMANSSERIIEILCNEFTASNSFESFFQACNSPYLQLNVASRV